MPLKSLELSKRSAEMETENAELRLASPSINGMEPEAADRETKMTEYTAKLQSQLDVMKKRDEALDEEDKAAQLAMAKNADTSRVHCLKCGSSATSGSGPAWLSTSGRGWRCVSCRRNSAEHEYNNTRVRFWTPWLQSANTRWKCCLTGASILALSSPGKAGHGASPNSSKGAGRG